MTSRPFTRAGVCGWFGARVRNYWTVIRNRLQVAIVCTRSRSHSVARTHRTLLGNGRPPRPASAAPKHRKLDPSFHVSLCISRSRRPEGVPRVRQGLDRRGSAPTCASVLAAAALKVFMPHWGGDGCNVHCAPSSAGGCGEGSGAQGQ